MLHVAAVLFCGWSERASCLRRLTLYYTCTFAKPVSDSILKPVSVCLCKCVDSFVLARNERGAFLPLNVTSGGNDFNDFSGDQLSKYRVFGS